MPSKPLPLRLWQLSIYNQVWVWELIIPAAGKLVIDVFNPLLHPMDERINFAHAVPAMLAALYPSKRNYTVVEHPANVRRFARLCVTAAGQNLAHEVDSKRHDFIHVVRL